MRTFLKTTHESDYVLKSCESLLSFFFSVLGVFLSFFCISFFLLLRARALCLSFSSSFADDNAPGWRRFGDALDDDDEKDLSSERMR